MTEAITISNHGGHSAFYCCHAVPETTPRDLIQSYIDHGFTQISITEHRPPFEERFLYPDEIQAGHSVASLQEVFGRQMKELRPVLQAEYSSMIELLFGFETEWCGRTPLEDNLKLVSEFAPDLVVLSVHHVEDICIDSNREEFQRVMDKLGGVENVMLKYYEHQFDLITGLVPAVHACGAQAVVGHFDLIKLFSDGSEPTPKVWELIERNIATSRDLGCPIELNARAFRKGLLEPYPSRAVLERIKALGAEITVGDDAHGPLEVGENYNNLQPFLNGFSELVSFEKGDNGIKKRKVKL